MTQRGEHFVSACCSCLKPQHNTAVIRMPVNVSLYAFFFHHCMICLTAFSDETLKLQLLFLFTSNKPGWLWSWPPPPLSQRWTFILNMFQIIKSVYNNPGELRLQTVFSTLESLWCQREDSLNQLCVSPVIKSWSVTSVYLKGCISHCEESALYLRQHQSWQTKSSNNLK